MIIVRRNFSEEADNKNAETRQQARVRKAGGVISAGLYGLSRKNLIKQNEEKNRRLAMRRERLAAKQKED